MDTPNIKPASVSRNKTNQLKEKISTNLFAYSLLGVPLLHFIVFYIYVNASSFVLPFIEQATGKIGTANFRFFFNDLAQGANSELLQNLKNTLIFFLSNFIMNPLAYILAYFISKKIFGYKIFKVIFVLPMIVSSVVLVAIYKNLLSAGGPLEGFWLELTGNKIPYFLYTDGLAVWAIVAYTIWTGFGMNLILFSGAMARIPESVLEYSKIDGCGTIREMFQIIMPIIWPTVSIMMLLSIIGIFGADGPIILFSGGMYGTSTIGYWMYQTVILNGKYNFAATFGSMLTLATVPIFLTVRWLFKKMPEEITF